MKTHTIKKGFDIRLAGSSEATLGDAAESPRVAVVPRDFAGIKPKLLVQEGDDVRTGDPLFFDKKDKDTMFLSPATGKVAGVVLGKRRALLRVEVDVAAKDDYAEIASVAADQLGATPREELIGKIKQAGLWPLLRQRPVGRVADGTTAPVAIFVNGMDTEPLAANPAFAVQGQADELQAGVELLRALTDGTVYLTVGSGDLPKEFGGLTGVDVHAFHGPHPAGLVGTHLNAIRPLRPGETAWFLKAQELAVLGRWVTTGRYPHERVAAVAGSEAPGRSYLRTRQGAQLASLTGGRPLEGDVRLINGTVLNGTGAEPDGYLGFYAQTVTVIPEGTGQRDMFGWLLPQTSKLSAARSVWSWLKPKSEYVVDARLHGGPRGIVNIGQMEAVTPLDIYPSSLMRAIQAKDLEEAIELGLLEVTEEDVALCTFVDPCKADVGQLVRKGLDLYEAEG